MKIVRNIVSPIARGIVLADSDGTATEENPALQPVRDLDVSNGGDFAISILDFGKASKRFADFDGTTADVGDSVALVLDDVSDDLGPELANANTASTYGGTGGNNVTESNGAVTIEYVDDSSFYRYLSATLGSGAAPPNPGVIKVTITGYTNTGSVNVNAIGDANRNIGVLSDTPATVVGIIPNTSSGPYVDFGGLGAGESVTITEFSYKQVPGLFSVQNTAVSRPLVTTDALGRTPISTDGGDDRLDLPDGWLGSGTEAFTVSMAVAPNAADSESFARLFGSPAHQTEAWLDSGKINFRTADGGSASQPTLNYARPVTGDEPLVLSFSWAPNSAPTMRLNGQQVAKGTSAFAALDALTDNALFGRGTNELAATAWATVSVVGSRAMTDAEIRTIESYLASLADVTLAPQTRDEALTVLRRPATPATDLNVTENFDYADTAALLEVWTDSSSGGTEATLDAVNKRLLLSVDSGGAAGSVGRSFPTRPGYRYSLTITGGPGSDGIATARFGTSFSDESYGTTTFAAGQARTVIIDATAHELVVRVTDGSANDVIEVASISSDEIPRTTAVYDMLNEENMTDSEGGTQALDAGVEILLPSVAEGDAAFGPELVADPTMSDVSAWVGPSTDGTAVDNGDGTITFANIGSAGNVIWKSALSPTNIEAGAFYRHEFSVSAFSGAPEIRTSNNVDDFTVTETGNGQVRYAVAYASQTANHPSIVLSAGESITLSAWSMKRVLHYPLQQSTAAAQPTLRYTLHDYLAGVVFSGKETATGTLDTPLNEDFTGYASQSAAESAGWIFNNAAITFDAANNEVDWSGAQAGNARLGFTVDNLKEGDFVHVTWTIANYAAGRSFATLVGFDSDGNQMANGPVSALIGPIPATFAGSQEVGIVGDNSFIGSITDVKVQRGVRDLSSNNNGPAVNGSLTVSTPAGVSGTLGPELITNGDFTSDAAGWTLNNAPNSSQSVVDGRLRITKDGGDGNARTSQLITTVSGQSYKLVGEGYQGTSPTQPQVKVGTGPGSSSITSENLFSDGPFEFIFTATGTTTYITLQNNGGPDGAYVEFDNISTKSVPDALSTVYSGFSTSNYLEHTTDHLDPGTGDWSITRVATGSFFSRCIFDYANYSGSYSGGRIRLSRNPSANNGLLRLIVSDGAGTDTIDTATDAYDPSANNVITAVRRGAELELWVGGSLAASGTVTNATGDLSGGVMRTGAEASGGAFWSSGSIGSIMLDTSGYAPTEEEIIKVHSDLDAIYNRTEDNFVFASLEFDGGDDYFEAVDPDGDLAITGDVTIVSAAAPDNVSGAKILASARSSTTNVAPWVFWVNNNRLSWVQGDGVDAPTRSGTAVTELSSGVPAIISGIRKGAEITFARDISAVETVTQFNSAVPPISDSNVTVEVGSQIGGSVPHDGTYSGLAIYDGALPTGQVVVLEAAMDTLSKVVADPIERAFVMEVEGSGQFHLAAVSAGTYAANVDWGDGTTSYVTSYNDPQLTHTYASAGPHKIRITGSFPRLKMGDSADRAKVTKVENLGYTGFNNMAFAFANCTNLHTFIVGNADTSNVGSMADMFIGCSSLRGVNFDGLDTSAVTDFSSMFQDCTSLQNLSLRNWDTSSATNMGSMFFGCTGLETLTLDDFDTSSVLDFSSTFRNCSSLTTLDLSRFNTSSATNMNSMFHTCSDLVSLDISRFNTANVTSMQGMFHTCQNITNIDLRSFDTTNVTTMSYMFWNCINAESINVRSFSTPSLTGSANMFGGCHDLTSLDLSGFDMSGVANMSNMFRECRSLGVLDLSSFVTTSATNMASMFYDCESLTSLDISNFDTSEVTNMSNMFRFCEALPSLDVTGFDTSSATKMEYMFTGCGNLTTLDVSGFNTSNVLLMNNMFQNCSSLEDLRCDLFDISSVTNLSQFCDNVTLPTQRYDAILVAWDAQSVNSGLSPRFGGSTYTSGGTGVAEAARNSLINNDGWTFVDGGPVEGDLVFTAETTTAGETFTLGCNNPSSAPAFNAVVDWGDGTTNAVTAYNDATLTHTYASPGTHTIRVSGVLPGLNMNRSSDAAKIRTVQNLGVLDYHNLFEAFKGCSGMTSFTLGNSDTSIVANFQRMFENCSTLLSLDLRGMDTSSATTLQSMFKSCSALTSLDVSTLDTSSVTRMEETFYGLSSITSLDLSNFDTSNVTTFQSMFRLSPLLETLDISSFNTSSGVDFSSMFSGLRAVTSLDVSGFDTSSATELNSMFYQCESITSIDVSSFDTSLVEEMQYMFAEMRALTQLDVSNFNTSNVSRLDRFLRSCDSLQSVDLSNFDTSSVTTMESLFYSCQALTNLDLSNFDTSQVTSMRDMFNLCRGLVSVDVSSFNTSMVTTFRSMFSTCDKLESLDVTNFDTSLAESLESMFNTCRKLTSIPGVSNFNTSQVTVLSTTFQNCSDLESLDVSGWDTSNATTMAALFSGCESMTSLNISGWDTAGVLTFASFMNNMPAIQSVNVSSFDTSSATSMRSMFNNCRQLSGLDVSGFDTSSVTNMESMFRDCVLLTDVRVDLFDISSVTNLVQFMRGMGLTTERYDATLIAWAAQTVNSALTPNFANSKYTVGGTAEAARNSLISNDSWVFTDAGPVGVALSGLPTIEGQHGVTKQLTLTAAADTVYGTAAASTTAYQWQVSNDGVTGWTNIAGATGNTYTPINADQDKYLRAVQTTSVVVDGETFTDTADSVATSQIQTADFVMTVRTTSSNESFEIPCQDLGTFNCTVDWGDGSTSNVTAYNDANLQHTYASSGTHTIRIRGTFPNIYFNFGGDRLKLRTIENLGVVGWQTLADAFEGCINLTDFTAGNSDTSSVTSMEEMFEQCSNLVTCDLSNMDTSSCTLMYLMFQNCNDLTTLDLSSFDVSNVTRMDQMFEDCLDLESITFGSNWSTDSLLECDRMFTRCRSLTSLDLTGFILTQVDSLGAMFEECQSLTTLDVSMLDTSDSNDFARMFANCYTLQTLDVSTFDTQDALTFKEMFRNCFALTAIDVSGFDTSNATNLAGMFEDCSSVTSIDVSNFDTSSVTRMEDMFQGMALTSLNVSNFDTSNVTAMDDMFKDLPGLTSLDLSSFDTSNVTTMSEMFNGNTALQSLNLGNNWDTSSVSNMHMMFHNCSSLTDVRADLFDISSVTDLVDFADGCTLNTSRYDAILVAWEAQTVNSGLAISFGSSQYTSGGAAETARTNLINSDGWTITDGGSV